jgi:peptide/nickel transport system substrate-binding protein
MIDVDAERRGTMLVVEQGRMVFAGAEFDVSARIPNFPSADHASIAVQVDGPDLERFRYVTRLPGMATGAFSVGFELAADPETPIPKQIFERTESYAATDDLTVTWTGIPGFLDHDYRTNIWTPYPRHHWGKYSAADLLEVVEANNRPLSHGPYVLTEWVSGDHITLERNENYYQADEGLPKVDIIRFNFIPSGSQLLAQLLTGECDIGTTDGLSMAEAPFLIAAEQNGQLVAHFQSGTVFEHIDFGINPVEEFANTRPDWFENPRVRQAFVMCTDRQRMIDELLYGQAEIIHSYVPSIHPLYPEDMTEWPYDVDAANEILDSVGFVDVDEDGIRDEPVSGSRFSVTLNGPLGNELIEQVAEIFQENLADCGIEVDHAFIHSDPYFADGPDGSLFGRQFDLAAFPWLISVEPNCGLYLSSRIPGPDNNWSRNYNNAIGFSDEEFDVACETALASLPGTGEYEENHRTALGIWSDQMPIIPLFMRVKLAATRPDVRNFVVDPTQGSELWNLYEIDVE